MRTPLDECIDWRLSRDITGHEVKTTHQMGWTALKNGDLLSRAEQWFDVFVTVDRNLSFQEDMVSFKIAVVGHPRTVLLILGRLSLNSSLHSLARSQVRQHMLTANLCV